MVWRSVVVEVSWLWLFIVVEAAMVNVNKLGLCFKCVVIIMKVYEML